MDEEEQDQFKLEYRNPFLDAFSPENRNQQEIKNYNFLSSENDRLNEFLSNQESLAF